MRKFIVLMLLAMVSSGVAAKGESWAQSSLGAMYNTGLGVVQDYAESAKWYRLAAAQRYAIVQRNLGEIYAGGHGVPKDYVLAHMWFNLGAVSGDADSVKNRDIIAQRMTPQQLADAQMLARECQARQFKSCN